MTTINIQNWGLINYEDAWQKQEVLFKEAIERKRQGLPAQNIFVLCEHRPVYTIGKSGHDNNMLVSDEYLQSLGAQFVHTNRGGDITYHGPGQIVGYPIFDLESFHMGLKQYIYKMEDAIIKVLDDYGIRGQHYHGATGVWLDVDTPQSRKICAIGVRSSHFVTMHGFALNVNTDLNYFKNINPCGFVDKGVCSIQSELGREVSLLEVEGKIIDAFRLFFNENR